MPQKLSHYEASARASMVDVRSVPRLKSPKGNPLEIARIAGPAASKGTPEWIPLCHPPALTHIDVTATLCQNDLEVRSSVVATAQTGVEMEALVAVAAAALTIYDMCKAPDKAIEFAGIALVSKTGSRSGDFRPEHPPARSRASKSRSNRKSPSKRGAQ